MNLSAWLFGGITALLLYGGLALCIRLALRNRRQQSDEDAG